MPSTARRWTRSGAPVRGRANPGCGRRRESPQRAGLRVRTRARLPMRRAGRRTPESREHDRTRGPQSVEPVGTALATPAFGLDLQKLKRPRLADGHDASVTESGGLARCDTVNRFCQFDGFPDLQKNSSRPTPGPGGGVERADFVVQAFGGE